MRLVMKFGGTSVGSAEAIEQVVEIVRTAVRQHQVVVVVSAMNAATLRTTDTLIAAARAAADGDRGLAQEAVPRLLALYMDAARRLATPEECQALEPQLKQIVSSVGRLCDALGELGELTPRALDLISGQGERCNARLIAAALRSVGLDAVAIDATELIVTNDHFGNAAPQMEETSARSQGRLLPLIERGTVPVVTGFISATPAGIPTTLGRGGSDYSCAILGAALAADEVQFWKEVDGVMTANPKIVPTAQPLPQLSYVEMAELSYYGANILHPRTVYPVVQRGIPIRIRNTFNPAHAGTLITADAVAGTAKAVTMIGDVSLITVSGPGLLGMTGAAGRIFSAVARARVNTLLITQASSEQNVCLAVLRQDTAAAVGELRRELRMEFDYHNIEDIGVIEPVVIVAVVGSGQHGTPGIAGRVFGALGDAQVNVIAIAQGSTEYNISFVVAEADGHRAVSVVHDAFGLAALP